MIRIQQRSHTTQTYRVSGAGARTGLTRRAMLLLATSAGVPPACRAGGQRAPAQQAGPPVLRPATIEWYKYLNPAQAQ